MRTDDRLQTRLVETLERRRRSGALRTLQVPETNAIDFCSNDYLGLARSVELQRRVDAARANLRPTLSSNGSTGSRLITGNSSYAMQVETQLAQFYKRYVHFFCISIL